MAEGKEYSIYNVHDSRHRQTLEKVYVFWASGMRKELG
jgi:hypothetical protein